MVVTDDGTVGKLNIKRTRGKRCQVILYYKAVDISGYTFDFRIRTGKGDGAADLLAGTIASGHVAVSYPQTDPDGDTATRVTTTFSATEMAVTPGDYPWEIEATGGGVKDPAYAVQGMFTVEPEYTL